MRLDCFAARWYVDVLVEPGGELKITLQRLGELAICIACRLPDMLNVFSSENGSRSDGNDVPDADIQVMLTGWQQHGNV